MVILALFYRPKCPMEETTSQVFGQIGYLLMVGSSYKGSKANFYAVLPWIESSVSDRNVTRLFHRKFYMKILNCHLCEL